MYVGRQGLGEVMPAADTGSRDSVFQGSIANVRSQWSQYQSGAIVGGNYGEFQEAVKLGWVPNSPEGFVTFLYWWTGTTADLYRAGLPELVGWKMAIQYASLINFNFTVGNLSHLQRMMGEEITSPQSAVTVANRIAQQAVSAARQNGWATDAQASVALEAFRRFFPMYLGDISRLALPVASGPVVSSAPAPAPTRSAPAPSAPAPAPAPAPSGSVTRDWTDAVAVAPPEFAPVPTPAPKSSESLYMPSQVTPERAAAAGDTVPQDGATNSQATVSAPEKPGFPWWLLLVAGAVLASRRKQR